MVNTEQQIQKTLIRLMDRYEIEDIDVNMICKSLDIKRQTFYYHFKNIYDVIYSIYCYQKVGDLIESDLNSLVASIFTFLYKDQTFNITIAKSNANDVLRDFLASYANMALIKMLDKYNLSIDNKRDISRFYSAAIAQQCLHYFSQEYSIKEGVQKIALLFNEDILKQVIRKCQSTIG